MAHRNLIGRFSSPPSGPAAICDRCDARRRLERASTPGAVREDGMNRLPNQTDSSTRLRERRCYAGSS